MSHVQVPSGGLLQQLFAPLRLALLHPRIAVVALAVVSNGEAGCAAVKRPMDSMYVRLGHSHRSISRTQ